MKFESLEGIRGFAAVYVFLHHLDPLAGTPWAPLLKLGQEAVLLFFLVSGFVIAYSQLGARARKSATRFLYHRAIRIYPIFLAALALSALAAVVAGTTGCINAQALAGNLLMLQDIGFLKSGTWVEPFCANLPLWSLAYEWWFYVAFAILFASERWSMTARRRVAAAGALLGAGLFLVHPSQAFLFAAYFSLWWAGLELALEFLRERKISFRGQQFSMFLLLACAAIWAIPVVRALSLQMPLVLGREPFLQLRHFGAGIVFLILAIVASRVTIVPNGVIRLFSRAAPWSYGLYASHQPVIDLVRAMHLGAPLAMVVTVCLAFLVAYLLEIVIHPRVAAWLAGPGLTTNLQK